MYILESPLFGEPESAPRSGGSALFYKGKKEKDMVMSTGLCNPFTVKGEFEFFFFLIN